MDPDAWLDLEISLLQSPAPSWVCQVTLYPADRHGRTG
jgi:hypothetical protein